MTSRSRNQSLQGKVSAVAGILGEFLTLSRLYSRKFQSNITHINRVMPMKAIRCPIIIMTHHVCCRCSLACAKYKDIGLFYFCRDRKNEQYAFYVTVDDIFTCQSISVSTKQLRSSHQGRSQKFVLGRYKILILIVFVFG